MTPSSGAPVVERPSSSSTIPTARALRLSSTCIVVALGLALPPSASGQGLPTVAVAIAGAGNGSGMVGVGPDSGGGTCDITAGATSGTCSFSVEQGIGFVNAAAIANGGSVFAGWTGCPPGGGRSATAATSSGRLWRRRSRRRSIWRVRLRPILRPIPRVVQALHPEVPGPHPETPGVRGPLRTRSGTTEIFRLFKVLTHTIPSALATSIYARIIAS